MKHNYIYTNKTHSQKAVMSFVFGMLALATILLALYFAFLAGGAARPRDAAAGLLSFVFSLIGMALGIMARLEEDKYYVFAYAGMFCSFAVLAGDVGIFLLGIL